MATSAREPAPPIARERLDALVRELIRERKLYKQAIAKDLFGITPEHLSRLVAGDRTFTLDLVDQIARRVGFDPHYFTADEASSYKEFERGPEHVLQGKAGVAVLSRVLSSADAILRAAADGSDEPELVEQLASDVLSLQPVLAAYRVLSTRDREAHRREGVPLAWAVKHLLLEAQRTEVAARPSNDRPRSPASAKSPTQERKRKGAT